jgi:hypothetical protein
MHSGPRYRPILLALILLLSVLPVSSYSAEITIQSDTIFRMFERDTVSENDALVLPGYEYLQIDGGQLEEEGLSFHLYGWGRLDFADNDYYTDDTAGEVLYGYLQYRQDASNFDARLGRQYVFEGVANEAIDGLRISSDLGDYFKASLYGGQPVGLDATNGRDGDSIYGGRIAHHLGNHYEVGLSYKKIENDSDTAEEMFGVDVSAFLPANMSVFGNSTYNQETEDWAEHSYELRIPLGQLLIKPYYQHFSYADYFGTGANAVNPFQGLALSDEELSAYGVDALYSLDRTWTFGGKVKIYDYDNFDGAETYSALLTWQGEEMTLLGGEIGHTAADDAAGNDYTLFRLYGYCEAMADQYWLDFFSGDLLLTYYDEDIYGEDASLFLSLSAGKKFMDEALTVALSGDYSQDPYFDDDLRGMLTLSYRYDRD